MSEDHSEMPEDDDVQSKLDVEIKLALLRQRQRGQQHAINCLRASYKEHLVEALDWRDEMKEESRKNREALTSLRLVVEEAESSRAQNSVALQEIREYVQKEKTISEVNRKHITLAAGILGGLITIAGGLLLFVGDMVSTFFKE